ncbi:MAG: hypothetical protein ABSE92_12005 [Terriglobales bacterium]|jgi:hypothetical protein
MMQFMNKLFAVTLTLTVATAPLLASPMVSAARTVIPGDVQQIITVDYRTLKDSDTAMALKAQVLPDNLKEFESALKGIGINPDKDLDALTFAAFRTPKQGLKMIGVASGSFSAKTVLKKMAAQKVKPMKYHDSNVYPMSGGMNMTFLDDSTLLFGDNSALQAALNSRDGYTTTMDSNQPFSDMISSVEAATVWSVLDQDGTQNMLISALGDAGKLADFDTVKKHVVGSRYGMNFDNGVKFDMDVVASDSVTAATLSSLVKAGMLYKKMTATSTEKVALDNMTVNSDGSNLQMHFKADDKEFQSLMHSQLFAAVSK